jgi:hypothetical protein
LTSDLQRHFDTATAFFLAGERCSLEMRFGQYGFHSVGAPTITNYALSVELALKLLHTISGKGKVRGHNLKCLLDSLPDEVRFNLPHLADCVSDIRRYFEDWRYPHEQEFLIASEDGPRRAFIERYREIRRLRPDLSSIYEQLWGAFEPSWLRAWAQGESLQARDVYPMTW